MRRPPRAAPQVRAALCCGFDVAAVARVRLHHHHRRRRQPHQRRRRQPHQRRRRQPHHRRRRQPHQAFSILSSGASMSREGKLVKASAVPDDIAKRPTESSPEVRKARRSMARAPIPEPCVPTQPDILTNQRTSSQVVAPAFAFRANFSESRAPPKERRQSFLSLHRGEPISIRAK